MPGPGLPTRAALHETGLFLALQPIEPDALRDPLMQHTITRLGLANAFVQIANEDLGKATVSDAPAGIVFHVGRCGSTLISQSLKQHGGAVIYSEPLPFNELLSLPPGAWPRARIVGALRSLGAAFAAHAGGPYVLKLSSWSTLFCDVVAEAFPGTPWAFNLRDPIEVGEAITRDPPPWFMGSSEPARHITHVVDPETASTDRHTFFALLFAAFCDAIGRLDLRGGILVDYAQLPGAIPDVVAPHFGLSVDPAQRARMLSASTQYAKAPLAAPRAFANDSAAKRSAASPELRAAVDAIARPALERLRTAFAAR